MTRANKRRGNRTALIALGFTTSTLLSFGFFEKVKADNMADNSKEQEILKLLIAAQEVQESLRDANRVFIPSFMRRQGNQADHSYEAAFNKLHSKLSQLTMRSEKLRLFENECRSIKVRVDAEDKGVAKVNEIWNQDKRIDVAQIHARPTLREMAAQYTNIGNDIDAILSSINQTELGQKISSPKTIWAKKTAFYVQASVLKQELDSARSKLSTYSMNPKQQESKELDDCLKKTEEFLNTFDSLFKGDKDVAALFNQVKCSAQDSLVQLKHLKLEIDGPREEGTFTARHSRSGADEIIEETLKSLRKELTNPTEK